MSKTWLLIRREFVERVRQRSFLWATAIGVVMIIGLALLPQLLAGLAKSTATKIVVAAPDAAAATATSQALAHAGNDVHVVSMHVTDAKLPARIRTDLNKG